MPSAAQRRLEPARAALPAMALTECRLSPTLSAMSSGSNHAADRYAEASFTWAGFKRGAAIALPFGASSAIYGIGFGVLAGQVGLSAVEAVVMSAAVFSGSAQLAIVQSWNNAAGLLPIFITVVIANIRYVLMGAALRPWLAALPRPKAYATLLMLVDGAFALGQRELAAGRVDAAVILGSAVVSYTCWVIATGAGLAFGQLVPDPKAVALDFIVVAFCASAAGMMWRGSQDIAPAIAALAAGIAADRWLSGAWVVVAAALAAMVVGALRRDSSA